MSQQQRPAWTGSSDEALVPLGRGDDPTPVTERDGHPDDGAQAPAPPSPPAQARPATEHVPADPRPAEQGQGEVEPTSRDDLAIWLFTSGSTGKPKAAHAIGAGASTGTTTS